MARYLIIVTLGFLYLITLSWPEVLFWSKLAEEIYQEFSDWYVIEILFGAASIAAILGISASRVLNFLGHKLVLILQGIFLIPLLTYINIVGFAIPTYVVLDFSKIELADFADARLVADWIKTSIPAGDDQREDRANLFAYGFYREMVRGNIQRADPTWYAWLSPIINAARPFEVCVPQVGRTHCSRDLIDETKLTGNGPERMRRRFLKLNTGGDVQAVDQLGARVIKMRLQAREFTWRGQRPAKFFDKSVDMPSEALTDVFAWLGTLGDFSMARPAMISAKELEYAKDLFWRRTGTSKDLASYEAVERTLEEKVRSNPNDMISFFLLGTAHIYTGKWDKAEERLQSALKLAPDTKNYILFQLGMLKYYQGQFSDAEGYYKSVLDSALVSNDTWGKDNLWWIHDRLGLATWRAVYKEAQTRLLPFSRSYDPIRIGRAISHFEESLRLAPPSGPVLIQFHVAQLYTHLGEFDATIGGYLGVDSLYTNAAQRTQGLVRSEVLFRHGQSLRVRGHPNWTNALEKYREAIAAGQCSDSIDSQNAGIAYQPAGGLGFVNIDQGTRVCIGDSYFYSNIQPLVQYLILQCELAGGDTRKRLATDAINAIVNLISGDAAKTAKEQPGRFKEALAGGKPKFYAEIKVDVATALGILFEYLDDLETAADLLQFSIRIESSLYNKEGRSVDFRFPDGRLALARVYRKLSKAAATDERSQLSEKATRIAREGLAFSIPTTYIHNELAELAGLSAVQ